MGLTSNSFVNVYTGIDICNEGWRMNVENNDIKSMIHFQNYIIYCNGKKI